MFVGKNLMGDLVIAAHDGYPDTHKTVNGVCVALHDLNKYPETLDEVHDRLVVCTNKHIVIILTECVKLAYELGQKHGAEDAKRAIREALAPRT